MCKVRTYLAVSITLLAWLFCGCSSVSETDQELLSPADAAAASGPQPGAGLPSPGAVHAGVVGPRTVSAASLRCAGSAYLPGRGQLVTVEDAFLRFEPNWVAPASGVDDAAYAIYRCNLEGVTETMTLSCAWDTPPADYGDVWLGLSNWDADCWEWREAPTDDSLELGAGGAAPYAEPSSFDIYIVVLLLGTSEAVLSELTLDGAYTVSAALAADPTTGAPPLTVNFDAAGSSSPAGDIVKYEWDWDGGGDGPWDEDSGATPTIAHEYASEGEFTAWVKITDSRGATDTDSVELVVDIPPGPGDWWMFGHDALHQRRSPFAGPATNTLRWSYDAGDAVGTAPAFAADGTIYFGGGGGKLYAVNPDSSEQWTYDTGGSVSCPAIGADGTIYAGSWSNALYAINPDGTLHWLFPTGGGVGSPAIGADGTIYVGCGDNKLYAVNPDGTEQWTFPTGGTTAWACPAVGADGTVYITSWDDNLYAVNPDGTQKWAYPAVDDMGYAAAIAPDGTIYVGSYDDNLYAINPDGSQQWKCGLWGDIDACPALGADGTIYVACGDGYLYEVHADGSLGWKFGGYDMMWPSPAIDADGTIYCGNWDNKLYAVNPDGTEKWSYETGDDVDSSPAIGADGTVYFGSNDGKLYAIGPGGV